MNERLDYLLSIALDDELSPDERNELDRLLAEMSDTEEAIERRASFAMIGDIVRNIGEQPTNVDTALDANLESIRARLEKLNSSPEDELAPRRRRSPAWLPSLGLAAAAALAVYVVLPSDSLLLFSPQTDAGVSNADKNRVIADPIALAVVFEIENDAESVTFMDSMTAEDFEVIEQLELLEFLAAREAEGRG